MNPTTPDGRYFVVKQQLWRCSNPALLEGDRQRWVKALMTARRAVKSAKASGIKFSNKDGQVEYGYTT